LRIEKRKPIVHQAGIIPVGFIAHPTVLEVPKDGPLVVQTNLGLCIEVEIPFAGNIVIITVPDLGIPGETGPDDLPKVISFVFVVTAPENQFQGLAVVGGRKNGPVEIIVQPAPSNQVRGLNSLPVHGDGSKAIVYQGIVLSVLLKISSFPGLLQVQSPLPTGCQ